MLEIDSLRVNLRLDGVLVRELFEVNWRYESGLVTNIEQMVEEYRQIRGLEPVRVCVLGPPAVGKTTVSKLIAEHYKIHHLTVKDTIAETISRLEEAVKEPESEESATEAQELLNNLKDSMEQSGGSLDEQLLVKLMKEKLMSNPCRNQGYVLDGVPETYDQAKELFSDSETEVSGTNVPSAKITPEFVLCLDAPDEILQDRVMNMPEGLGEHSTVYELFLQRLSKYRDDNKGDEAEDFFDELDIPSTCREITNDDEPDSMMLMQMVTDAVGKPRNYGPTNLEMEEEERRKTEEKMRRENQQRVQEEQKEIEEARQRAVRWEEWRKGLEQVRQQEQDLLEAQSAPMKNYLMEHVMPTLTKGLIECCMEQPLDPVDFLAEYLFKNNPYDAEVTSLTLTDLDQKEEDEEKDKEEVEVEGEEEEEEEADCSDED
ncbi:adenylate kinase 7-like [Cynoglossus semilaevis]|uniref:adenylate kinase 7-like n=1 Tax=Cynoglossus semilaevis TaxID=244447 RepID=UPI0007DCA90F|nr:adenylate kinase 7-like [Cynoglossus semilaevis]